MMDAITYFTQDPYFINEKLGHFPPYPVQNRTSFLKFEDYSRRDFAELQQFKSCFPDFYKFVLNLNEVIRERDLKLQTLINALVSHFRMEYQPERSIKVWKQADIFKYEP